jgi:hypothetical protein
MEYSCCKIPHSVWLNKQEQMQAGLYLYYGLCIRLVPRVLIYTAEL